MGPKGEIKFDGRIVAVGGINQVTEPPSNLKHGDVVLYGDVSTHNLIGHAGKNFDPKIGDMYIPGSLYIVHLPRTEGIRAELAHA